MRYLLLTWVALNATLGWTQTEPTKRNGGNLWTVALEQFATGRHRDAVNTSLDYLAVEPQRYQIVAHHFEEIARTDAANTDVLVFVQATGTSSPPPERISTIVATLREAVSTNPTDSRDPLHAAMLLSAIALQTFEPEAGLAALIGIGGRSDVSTALYQYATHCETAGFDAVAAKGFEHYAASPRGDPQYQPGSLLKQAELHERQGRYTLALSVYRQLVERYPARSESHEAVYRQGRLLLYAFADVTAARELLLPLSTSRAGHVSDAVDLLLAECDLVAGDLDKAENLYRQLIARSGRDWMALYGLGRLAFFRAEFDSAVAHLDTLIGLNSGHKFANDALELVTFIESQRELGHETELETYASSMLLQYQGRIAAAEKERRLLFAGPNDIEIRARLDQALAYKARTQDDSAMAVYDAIITTLPDHHEALTTHLLRAQLLERLSRPLEALEAFETCLLHFSEDPRAAQIRLEIQRLRRLYSEAG